MTHLDHVHHEAVVIDRVDDPIDALPHTILLAPADADSALQKWEMQRSGAEAQGEYNQRWNRLSVIPIDGDARLSLRPHSAQREDLDAE